MLTIEELSKIIDQKPLWILDGAVGTELERLGYQTHLPLWTATANAEVPALIQQIHMRYAAAGADILTANTFRTSYYTYKKTANEEGAILACKQGVQLAREVSE
ncbi:MAG: homocysteine S-methyltransferase family protein, partial [Saprospiraceae bacterium]|nr:homocysteine S-methyltransferase family protein [Saprospiraceae bacterium]